MTKKQLLAATIATILSTGLIATNISAVYAGDDPANTGTPANEQAAQETTDQKTSEDLFRVSDDALLGMRDLHSARFAIFNGEPALAQTYVDAAVTRMDAAVKDADKYALDIKEPKEDDMYVPFGASLTVLDTYAPTDAKAKHIAKANKHLHNGEQKKALETLKLGDVDVAISTELVPIKLARQHVADAAKLISDGKYYEANLALKAVDDTLVMQTYAIDEVPKAKADSSKSR